jgi:hypothetical protein
MVTGVLTFARGWLFHTAGIPPQQVPGPSGVFIFVEEGRLEA